MTLDRTVRELGWLLGCAALAAGEYAASFVPTLAETWPIAAALAVLSALFGHGFSLRGWRFLFLFLVGIALFLHASIESERKLRLTPWMRDRRVVERQVEPTGIIGTVRRDLSRRVSLGLEKSPEIAALNRAILLGERRSLPRRTKQVFIASGTMHIFAISGLHVMTVAAALAFLMSLLMVPRRIAGVAAMVPLWGYVAVVGGGPSAIRAASMATIYFAAPLFWRRSDALRAWAVTFVVFHVLRPTDIVTVGSALSFVVTLAIILAADLTRGLDGRKATLVMTTAAWAAGVPIAAHVFGCVTPGGLLANLVLIPTAGFSVLTGVVGVLTSFLSSTLAAHVNNLSALATSLMVFVAEIVSRLPGANIEVDSWPLWMCAAWYLVLILMFVLVRLKARRTLF